jgi:dTMP kinase
VKPVINSDFIINNHKGILLVYEGISGSGKSQGFQKLACYLSDLGLTFIRVEWNSNHTIRKIVIKLLKMGLLTPIIYSILQWISFFIDYFTIIAPALKKNQIVIADRYIYSGITRDVVNGSGRFMGQFVYRLVRKPDWVFYYDTPPAICFERIKSRGKALFHTNQFILRHKQLKNKDLLYLKRMRKEYVRVFADEKVRNRTNIVLIENDALNFHCRVEAYIFEKWGHENSYIYNKIT